MLSSYLQKKKKECWHKIVFNHILKATVKFAPNHSIFDKLQSFPKIYGNPQTLKRVQFYFC